MTTSYSWIEQIDSIDPMGGGVITSEIKKHTIKWEDVDQTTVRNGKVADETAICNALGGYPVSVNQRQAIDYEVNNMKNMQLTLFPEWFKQAAAAAETAVQLDNGPQFIAVAGEYAKTSDGGLISMSLAGDVFRDGVKMPGLAAQKIVTFHGKIFAKGKTVPSWWQWNGYTWGTAPLDPATLDPAIFT